MNNRLLWGGEEIKPKKQDEEQSKLSQEYLQQASYLGTILPLLDIFYDAILKKWIRHYNLNVVKEFWIYFGLLVFTVIYYYYGVRFEAIIFFTFATLFTLIVYNLDFFKRFLPNENKEIEKFLSVIEEKTSQELTDFIKDYKNRLNDEELKKIIDSKHGRSWLTYDMLLNYQRISSKILIHIIKTERIEIVGEKLFLKMLSFFNLGMDYDDYQVIVTHFSSNPRVIKSITALQPTYIKGDSIFKSSACFLQSFSVSLRLGRVSDIISSILFLLVLMVGITGYSQISSPYYGLEPYHTFPILFFINYAFALLLTFGLFRLVFLFVLSTFVKILQYVVWHFAPDQPQI